MQSKEWTFPEHADLPPGPWMDEPDKRQWIDETTGLPCLIVRNIGVGGSGNLCGYVGVPKTHPWHGRQYMNGPDKEIAVHGLLSYSNHCRHPICHETEEGDEDGLWWFGFDCAHAEDLIPSLFGMGRDSHGTYRDVTYVAAECAKLARQLNEVA